MADPNDISILVRESRSLESSLESLGIKLAIATAAVVLGLLIEYWPDVKETALAVFESICRQQWRPLRALDSKVKLTVIGGVFVTLGVGAELYFEHRTNVVEGDLERVNGRVFGILDTEAATQRLRAAGLEKEAAEIAESVAPRRLTATQRASLKSNLARFAENFVAFHNTDLESSVFSGELASALASARWKVPPNVSVGGNSGVGITSDPAIPQTGVLISATRDDASQRASNALIRELINIGFDCSRGEEFVKGATGPVREPLIYIHVLARPEGPQGEAKVRAQKAKKP